MGKIRNLDIGTGVRLGGLNKGLAAATQKISSWSASVPKIASGVAIGNLLSAGFGKSLGLIKSGLSQAFTIAVDTEQTEVAFSTLLGGADKAKEVLAQLREFGASTPFEFPELAEAGKKLLAFGFDAKSLVPQMRQLGDVAAGLGIPYAELADLFGKMKVSGRIMSEDLNQLMGRGIDATNGLAKVLGVVPSEVKDMASKGKIEFAHVQQMFANMTNTGQSLAEQFPDLGELISDVDGTVTVGVNTDAIDSIQPSQVSANISADTTEASKAVKSLAIPELNGIASVDVSNASAGLTGLSVPNLAGIASVDVSGANTGLNGLAIPELGGMASVDSQNATKQLGGLSLPSLNGLASVDTKNAIGELELPDLNGNASIDVAGVNNALADATKAVGNISLPSLSASVETAFPSLTAPELTGSLQVPTADVSKSLQRLSPSLSSSLSMDTGDAQEAIKRLAVPDVTSNASIDVAKANESLNALTVPSLDGAAKITGSIDVGSVSDKLNKLATEGVPVFETLAASMAMPIEQVKQLANQGKITGDQLKAAFTSPLGEVGQFANMMDAQSQTVGGLVSTLKDTVNVALGNIGTKLIETFDVKEHIMGMIGWLSNIEPAIDGVLVWVGQIKPVFVASIQTTVAYWTMFTQAIWSSLSFLTSLFGGFAGGGLLSFVKSFVTGLAIAEFVFNSWRSVLQLGVTTAMLNFVRFGNQLHHIFTVQIPTVLSWWANNGFEIIKNFAINAFTVLENLANNIVNVFISLPDLITGNMNFGDVWKPLTDGLMTVVKDLPNIPVRVESDFEKSLAADAARLKENLTGGLTTHINTKLEAAFPKLDTEKQAVVEPPKAPAINVAGPEVNIDNQKEQKFAKLAEVGSQESRDVLLRSMGQGFKGPQEETRDLAKQQLEIQKQQLAEIKKQRSEKTTNKETVLSIA